MMSSGFEMCSYHTSHVQWLPGKAMKRNCNIPWGSLAAKKKRWYFGEQLCQNIIFSFLLWLFLYYCFFKHMMRTGTEDTGGSWQFEWITILQKCFWVLWRDFYSGTSVSPNLWHSLACISLTQWNKLCFKEGSSRNFHIWFFFSGNLAEYESALRNLAVLVFILKVVLDESTLPAQVISQTWCNHVTQFLLEGI